MRASKRNRNARTIDPTRAVEPVSMSYPVISTGIKTYIAHVMRTFEISGADWGTCLARAAIGECYAHSSAAEAPRAGGRWNALPKLGRIVVATPSGSVSQTTGAVISPMDSTSYLIGHVWNEVSGEIADFLAGDWQAETEWMYASETNLYDLKLGPVECVAVAARIHLAAHRTAQGRLAAVLNNPRLVQIWYGPWFSHAMPDVRAFDQVIVNAAPIIADLVDALQLRERVANYLHHGMSSSPISLSDYAVYLRWR